MKPSICKYNFKIFKHKFVFNIFCKNSIIGNEEQLDFFELHICIKDYCFARDDRLVGVAVMQLKDIVDRVRKIWLF